MARRLPNLARRERGVSKPKFAVTVFCEGKKTEPFYIRGFARLCRNPLVRLEIAETAGVPTTLVEAALAELRRRRRQRRESFEFGDEVWVVFDCDEHKELPRAFEMARQAGIKVAFSNPCFELWAMLHFRLQDAPIHRHDLQKNLEECLKGYDRRSGKSIDVGLLSGSYADACARAKQLRSRRREEGNERGNPYTNVDELTEKIRLNGQISKS